jgi:hypothetical protein
VRLGDQKSVSEFLVTVLEMNAPYLFSEGDYRNIEFAEYISVIQKPFRDPLFVRYNVLVE